MNKKKIILAIVAAVVFLSLVFTVVVLAVKLSSAGNKVMTVEEKQEFERRNVVVTEKNVEEIIANTDPADFTPIGAYEVTMNSEWRFENGKAASSNAYVANAATNLYDVYFDVLLDGTEEVIYSSPLLPVGSHVEKITLNKELENGVYKCVVRYTLVDDDQRPLSNVSVRATIYIGQ